MNMPKIPSTDDDNASTEEKNGSLQGLAVTGPECERLRRTSTLDNTFFAQIDKSTCAALYQIISHRKFAALQLLWLLVCLSSFLFYASMQLYVAIKNERDENKLEKLDYVKDYGVEDSSTEYQMPYIYVFFNVEFPDWLIYDSSEDYTFNGLDYENRRTVMEAVNKSMKELYENQYFNFTANAALLYDQY